MKREIIITSDGSTTIHLPEWNEHYHSKHGAIQEAYHVFIQSGLHQFSDRNNINILEVGFGTGLNCFITLLEAEKLNLIVEYVGVEGYPVKEQEIKKLNYVNELNAQLFANFFTKMHAQKWNQKCDLSKNFSLTKRSQFFDKIDDKDMFDLIYFDAFGARVQPELWTIEIFERMYQALRKNGVVSYLFCERKCKARHARSWFFCREITWTSWQKRNASCKEVFDVVAGCLILSFKNNYL